MTISKHAEKRVRQRVGINKKAVPAHVENVLENGTHQNDLKGHKKKVIGAMAATYHSRPVLFGQHVYMFKGDTLVTVIPLKGNLV